MNIIPPTRNIIFLARIIIFWGDFACFLITLIIGIGRIQS